MGYFPLSTSVFFSMTRIFVIQFRCLANVRELSFVFSLSSMLRCHCPSDRILRIDDLALCALSV